MEDREMWRFNIELQYRNTVQYVVNERNHAALIGQADSLNIKL